MSRPPQRRGYFRVSHALFDDPDAFWNDARPFRRREAWLDLLHLAAWRKRTVSLPRGSVTLARSEFVASVRVLAERWQWSVGAVSQFLTALVARESLQAVRVACATQVYAVVNYDAYQTDIAPDPESTREQSEADVSDDVASRSADEPDALVNCAEHSNEHSRERSDECSREQSEAVVSASSDTQLGAIGTAAREHSREHSDERSGERSNEHNREGKRESSKKRTTPRVEPPRVVETTVPVSVATRPADRPGRSVAPRPPAPKYPTFAAADCDALHAAWLETWGACDYPRFRKALGPLFPRYTAAQLAAAIVAYREMAEIEDRFAIKRPSPETFAAGATEWVRIGAMDYATPDGDLTERGRRALAVPV